MDEYRCLQRGNKEDLLEIFETLKDEGSVVFSYVPGDMSQYDIVMTHVINFPYGVRGPFKGGMRYGDVIISVIGHGESFGFEVFNRSRDVSSGYVQEKLGCHETVAKHVAELINELKLL